MFICIAIGRCLSLKQRITGIIDLNVIIEAFIISILYKGVEVLAWDILIRNSIKGHFEAITQIVSICVPQVWVCANLSFKYIR